MAILETTAAFIVQNPLLFLGLLISYLFYLTLRLALGYRTSHNLALLAGAALVLVVGLELWTRVHEDHLRVFFQQFHSLLVLVPLSVFLIFVVLENRRKSAVDEKAVLRNAFTHYLSPAVVEEISEKKELKLGGEKKELTVLFCDIRGFSTMTERMPPEQVVSFANDYFNSMASIIMDHGGMVDKYIGDCIMAIWGAPIDDDEHASHACGAALAMRRSLRSFNEAQRAKGGAQVKVGIGISTGEMVVGNMGSDRHFDYTVMGDAVNLGARLQELTKQYGAGIIISDATRRAAKGFVTRELDRVRVRGKKRPCAIHQVVAEKGRIDERQRRCLASFAEGLRAYYARDLGAAKGFFEDAMRAGDPTAEVFLRRLERFARSPPPASWDGVMAQ